MELPQEKIQAVVDLLKSKGAKKILLFGSFLRDPKAARDLDLAVEGIPLRNLLAADAEAYQIVRQPLDLISREEDPAFYDHVASRAKVLYAA